MKVKTTIMNVFVYIKTGLVRTHKKIIHQLFVDHTFFTKLEPKQFDALLSLQPVHVQDTQWP